ncbi:hypothetical protein RDWZM_005968 [Blomia tropicalis]|uniref:MAGE domain-containing protein n=1 Tax=Blomia tropicalis TaxID=40697 RepID=A0A9Q0M671_BLOTA|nr:hypothetical protein RDWZM_005968 [Blomia tropicalis]
MKSRSNRNRAIVNFSTQESVASTSSTLKRKKGNNVAASTEDESTPDITNNIDMLINTSIRYILLQDYNVKPIFKADLSKLLTYQHTISKNDLDVIYKETEKRLLDIFGLKMIEINPNSYLIHSIYKHEQIHLDKTKNLFDKYLQNINSCVSLMGSDTCQSSKTVESSNNATDNEVETDDEEDNNFNKTIEGDLEKMNIDMPFDKKFEHIKRALTVISLTLIYMNEEPMLQAELIKMIELLGFNDDCILNVPHVITHNNLTAKKIVLEDLVKQNYLSKTKVSGLGPENTSTYVYDWGDRSYIEFNPVDIVQFAKKVYNEPESSIWIRIEKRALNDKRRNNFFKEKTNEQPISIE